MFKKMKHMKNEKGLTLIELLAVIVILAIIAAIAIPAIGNIINNQRDKAILSDISGLVSAAKIAYADGACDKTTSTCTYVADNGTGNQVEFDSEKFSGATVNFTNSTDPLIIISGGLAAADFKGKNKTAWGTKYTATAGVRESVLNTDMGN